MSDLSRDDLQVMIQVITRNTEQLSILVERFSQQAAKIEVVQAAQDKTNARLYNGMAKEIALSVIEAVKAGNQNCAIGHTQLASSVVDAIRDLQGQVKEDTKITLANSSIALDTSSTAKDANFIKILLGSIAIVVLVSVAVLKVLDAREVSHTVLKDEIAQLKGN